MNFMRQLVIGSFVVSIGGAIWLFANLRKELGARNQAAVVGSLRGEGGDALAARLNDFMEAQLKAEISHITCVHVLLGRDDRYAYVARACGAFHRTEDGVYSMNPGSEVPTRIELDGSGQPIAMEDPKGSGADFAQNYHALFPSQIQALNADKQDPRFGKLFEKGYQRQQQKTPSTAN